MIFADESAEKPLRLLLRKMRMYNPMPSHFGGSYNAKILNIIEDIVHRKSHLSYIVQTVDVIAYLLYSKEFPKGASKKYNLNVIFNDLEPLLLKEASNKDPLGIVRN